MQECGSMYSCEVDLASFIFWQAASDYFLDIRARTYRNDDHRVKDGTCCEHPFSACTSFFYCGNNCECDNRFIFCAKNAGSSHNTDANSCPLGRAATSGSVGDDNFFFSTSSIGGGVSNPITFPGAVWHVRHIALNLKGWMF